MTRTQAAELRSIFHVMLERPGGAWSAPKGRFPTKAKAKAWAGRRPHTVILSVLEPGEAPRFSRPRGKTT